MRNIKTWKPILIGAIGASITLVGCGEDKPAEPVAPKDPIVDTIQVDIVDDNMYYSVPTPLTDIYFKTVMRQGQSLDALLSVNTKPNLNFTIAYKSIRSVGDYFNNLTSLEYAPQTVVGGFSCSGCLHT
mgnify:CR=1 FL=1